jgi:hypothetical protein
MPLSRRNADRRFRNKGLDEVENLLEEATVLAKKMGKIKGRKRSHYGLHLLVCRGRIVNAIDVFW